MMKIMQDDIPSIRASFQKSLAAAMTLDDAEKLRVQYLGRRGALNALFDALKNLPPGERKRAGEQANALWREIEERLAEKRAELEQTGHEGILKKEWLDVTRPGMRTPKGHLHPITKITREIIAIFAGLGFAVAEGPEVETDFYNFQALNIPPGHPARDMWDTFWLRNKQKVELGAWSLELGANKETPHSKFQVPSSRSYRSQLLLRTHTSPVQIRYMETHKPPIRIIAPGIVYRYEATDASHEIQFSQLEGLMADKHISVANFKAVIGEFFAKLFTPQTKIRLRPSYFPFTEPSFEVDISCIFCAGAGCSVCKQSGWLELGGAGMVHPSVFKAGGLNPKDITGFAFGMGISRIAMMKYRIPDIRLFNAGDLRFLKQF